jgi:pimeloyl-ACP methyl ester carboxylesterase
MMLAWFLLSGTAVAAVGGSLSLILFPPLPRDLGGAVDLDAEAEPLRIPVPGDGHLDAWYLRGHRPAVVVLLHGFGRTHHRAWRYAAFLRQLGVHVLTFDFRSARGRGRKPTTLGHHERLDAQAVLDWVLREPRLAGCRIGVHGESLGAAIALQLAAARPEVAAVVADGAFATSARALEDSCERWARMPRQPSASILRAVGYACTGHDPGATEPLRDAPRLATAPCSSSTASTTIASARRRCARCGTRRARAIRSGSCPVRGTTRRGRTSASNTSAAYRSSSRSTC